MKWWRKKDKALREALKEVSIREASSEAMVLRRAFLLYLRDAHKDLYEKIIKEVKK